MAADSWDIRALLLKPPSAARVQQHRRLVAGGGLDPGQGVGDTARPAHGQDVSGPVEVNQSGLVDDIAFPPSLQA